MKVSDGAIPGIRGDALLSGLRIIEAVDGRVRLDNGKILYADAELGLLFEGGET